MNFEEYFFKRKNTEFYFLDGKCESIRLTEDDALQTKKKPLHDAEAELLIQIWYA